MASSFLCCIAAIFISSVSLATSQAPGDFESSCNDQIDYPSDWKILFDSNRYTRIASTWHISDLDNDFQTLSPVGGICTPAFFACGSPPQNNWIFSQLIHTLSAEEVFINVSLTDCFFEPCTDHISFYINSSEVDSLSRVDPTKYGPLEYTKTQGSPSTLLSSFQPEMDGFYFGLRDKGFCGTISRIVMYYRVCPERQAGLVSYPEVPLPPRNGPVEYFEASCVENAHNLTSLVFQADPVSGMCTTAAAASQISCECNLGYSEQNGACKSCPVGTFGVQGGKCMRCPGNSFSTATGSLSCQCQPGFYRTATEPTSQDCTAPPQAVGDLQAEAEDSSIALTWTRPASGGRLDIHYGITISDPSNLGKWIVINSRFESGKAAVSFNINDLLPDTSYEVQITTHNGVSDQDPAGQSSRTASVIVRTKQGVPGVPNLHRFCNVIIWSPPNKTGGVLTGYDLKIGSMPFRHFIPTENFYVTSEADKTSNVAVQIRATNAAVSGPWSEPQTIGCENQLKCTNIVGSVSPPASTSALPSATSAPPPTASAPPSTPSAPLPTASVPPLTASPHPSTASARPSTASARPSTASAPPPTASAPPPTAAAPPPTASSPPPTASAPPPTASSPPPTTSAPPPTTSAPPPTTSAPPPTTPAPPSSTEQPQAIWSCLDPPALSNGQVSVSESIASYSCNNGYVLQGSKERVCTIVGWSGTAPSCIRQCKANPPHFMLNNVKYLNNSQVMLQDIGQGNQALRCQTSSSNCCRGEVRVGEFYYPGGAAVGINAQRESFYRNRRDGEILLNRRPLSLSPIGQYECEILDGCDEMVSIYITLT